ncbi:hypothetical protein RKD52_003703 [Metabacillus sp. SLBN-84]
MKLQFDTFAKAEEFIEAVSPYVTTVTHFIFSQIQTEIKFDSNEINGQ